MKTVTSVTKDKHKKTFRNRPPFKGGPKTGAMVVNIKKQREIFKGPGAEYVYCQSLAASLTQFRLTDLCMIKREINQLVFKYQVKRFFQSHSYPYNVPTK